MHFEMNELNVFLSMFCLIVLLFAIYCINNMLNKSRILRNIILDQENARYSREELNNAYNNGIAAASEYIFHFNVNVSEVKEDEITMSRKEFQDLINVAISKINERIYKIKFDELQIGDLGRWK